MQTESVLIGQAMQHLGALLLELGRTILTLRMGQSPVCPFLLLLVAKHFLKMLFLQSLNCSLQAESSVNAGPAVYISPTGPNPIMVQVC